MWILLVASLCVAAYQLGKTKDPKYAPLQLKSGGPLPGQANSALAILDRVIGAGTIPTVGLLRAAFAEAINTGDPAIVEMVRMASRTLQPGSVATAGESTSQESVGVGAEVAEEFDGNPDSWGESANPSQMGVSASPPVTSECPLDGVSHSSWLAFCEALRTRKPEWTSNTHHGAWEHRKTRLADLGINADTLSTEKDQYDALCADMEDYYCRPIVKMFAGSVVDINGSKQVITPSGMLGLLKAAGTKGAEGWLNNPSDRVKFPRTTEVFIRCNGSF